MDDTCSRALLCNSDEAVNITWDTTDGSVPARSESREVAMLLGAGSLNSIVDAGVTLAESMVLYSETSALENETVGLDSKMLGPDNRSLEPVRLSCRDSRSELTCA